MAVIRFTHGYDLLHKIALMGGAVTVALLASEIVEPLSQPLKYFLANRDLDWIWVVLVIAYAIGSYVGSVVLLTRTVLPYWLPTLLYVRTALFTTVSADEATRLSFLFDGSLDGGWYPLGFLRKIEREYRREALFQFANKIAAQHQFVRPFPEAEPQPKARQQAHQHAHREAHQERTQQETAQSAHELQIAACLKILGLSSMPERFDVIRMAYRRKISQYHPDKFAGDKPEVVQYGEEMSKRINQAYAYLEKHLAQGMS